MMGTNLQTINGVAERWI